MLCQITVAFMISIQLPTVDIIQSRDIVHITPTALKQYLVIFCHDQHVTHSSSFRTELF